MMNLMLKAGYPIYSKLRHVSHDLWSESGQIISVTFNLFQSFFMHLYTNFASLHPEFFNVYNYYFLNKINNEEFFKTVLSGIKK